MGKIRFLIAVLLSTFTLSAYGQKSTKTEKKNNERLNPSKLIGTWRLIKYANLDSISGKWVFPYGENPKGYFTYTKNGIVNLNISSTIPLKISEDSTKNYAPTLYEYISNTALGYFGFYTVDSKKSIVTHHVKGGTIPNYIDTDQPRPFILMGDTLIIGDNKTWKRVLIRAD